MTITGDSERELGGHSVTWWEEAVLSARFWNVFGFAGEQCQGPEPELKMMSLAQVSILTCILCGGAFVCMCVCTPCVCLDALGDQKMAWDPLE